MQVTTCDLNVIDFEYSNNNIIYAGADDGSVYMIDIRA